MFDIKNWKEATAHFTSTVNDSIKRMHDSGINIILIVDDRGHLLGTVTDSDIRKAILLGVDFEGPITDIMNCSPKIVHSKMSEIQMKNYFLEVGLIHLPVVGDFGELVGLKGFNEFYDKEILKHNVLILAGGLGSRLGDLTKTCPKPMIKIGEYPLLELNIRKLKSEGFINFFISVNYMAETIEEYFGDGSRLGVNITYLKESERLGTAGPLALMPQDCDRPFLVFNGDLLTSLKFNDLLYYHNIGNYDVTVCVRKYDYNIPYGVLDLKGASVLNVHEKPDYYKFISAGVYIFNPQTLRLIEKNKYLDMNEFLNLVIQKKFNVECYIIKEYWRDIGTIRDLEAAREDYKSTNI